MLRFSRIPSTVRVRKGEILNNIEKRTFILRTRKTLFKLRNDKGELGKVKSHGEYQRKDR